MIVNRAVVALYLASDRDVPEKSKMATLKCT